MPHHGANKDLHICPFTMKIAHPNRTIAITGGGGFVGSALVAELLRRGYSVHVLECGDTARLAPWCDDPRLHIIAGDVRDAEVVDAWVRGCDVVLHLAAVVGVHHYVRTPLEVLSVNLGGTLAVAEACGRHGVALLLASTSEVYGNNPLDLREDMAAVYDDPAAPRWSYALSKAAAEQAVLALARSGLRAGVVRYFNVYGPGQDAPGEGRVLSTFIGDLQAGRPLRLVGGGDAVRSFCYVDDAVDATLRVADALSQGQFRGRVFNIGRKEPVTIAQLAAQVVALSGHPHGMVSVSGTAHFGDGFVEIQRRVPDVSAIQQATGWRATTPLAEGLARTLDAYGLLRCEPPSTEPPFLPQVRPCLLPTSTLLQQLGATLASGVVTNGGPAVAALETQLAAALGSPHAVAVSSGWAALTLAMRAVADQQPPARRVVLLPAYTFAASAHAVRGAGLQPEFVDIDADHWTISPTAVALRLAAADDVAAVLAVNAFGVPPPMAALAACLRPRGLALVLDEAHGVGTHGPDDYAATWADVRAISLHATKTVIGVEAGAVLTASPLVAGKCRQWRNHGLATAELLAAAWGCNVKLSELHALVGLHSLSTLAARQQGRRRAATALRSAIAPLSSLRLQQVPRGVQSSWQNLVVWTRDEAACQALVAAAEQAAIGVRRYFHPALHTLSAGAGSLPISERAAACSISLPLYDDMEDTEIARVVALLTAHDAVLRGGDAGAVASGGVAAAAIGGAAVALSIVAPLYNEEATVDAFVGRCLAALREAAVSGELIIVDDASRDGSCARLEAWAARHPTVRLLSQTENGGQWLATRRGLMAARGDCVIVLDSDLQDPPEHIPQLYRQWRQGHRDVVFACKRSRHDPWWLRSGAAVLDRLQRWLAPHPIPCGAGSYCALAAHRIPQLLASALTDVNLCALLASLRPRWHVLNFDKQARLHGASRVGAWRLAREAVGSLRATGALRRLVAATAVLVAMLGWWWMS
jgi:dTDP-4-amino-4,6-dideoxygalactose transaminase/nucleoside-diphosphate-sugar epimerase